jgi:hypothetical protein
MVLWLWFKPITAAGERACVYCKERKSFHPKDRGNSPRRVQVLTYETRHQIRRRPDHQQGQPEHFAADGGLWL